MTWHQVLGAALITAALPALAAMLWHLNPFGMTVAGLTVTLVGMGAGGAWLMWTGGP